MAEIVVNTLTKKYLITIKDGLFTEDSAYKLLQGRKALIITDYNIDLLYGKPLLKRLNDLNVDADLYVIPAGEKSKSHNELLKLYNYFGEAGITRNDYVVALGGGVTGDLAGFAASTYLRGINFLQIPTSLLAMVDSSVGGKVAVNLATGKNLVGSFYHPEAVLIDPTLLKTIPDRHFADGMAEIIKYGCIHDIELFSLLENINNRQEVMDNIQDIIFRSCTIKKEIVEKDEREQRLRMVLNFGHTFGHVVEKCFEYNKYTHGEAVAIGMVTISKLSNRLGICSEIVVERIKELILKYNLPTNFPSLKSEDVFNVLINDKKARTNNVNLVLIEDIGSVRIESFSKERIGELIHEMLRD